MKRRIVDPLAILLVLLAVLSPLFSPEAVLNAAAAPTAQQGTVQPAFDNPGPDQYGYTWNTDHPLMWIDATKGVDTGMRDDSYGQQVGPIKLPFSFPFYSSRFDALYIDGSGFVSFVQPPLWSPPQCLPNQAPPNGFITAFAGRYILANEYSSGRVFYRSGGTTPNRYFVVEWNNVRGYENDNHYTFEVILYESGDMVVQFLKMEWPGFQSCGATGIEDVDGSDGLWFGQPIPGSAVTFVRPQPAGRAKLKPINQGAFVQAGESNTYPFVVTNNGELGPDTYKVSVTSTWQATVRHAGGTNLADTDSDGNLDTGPVPQGAMAHLEAYVQGPPYAPVGASSQTTITLQSALSPARKVSAVVNSMIQAPFAQVYCDTAGAGVRVRVFGPQGTHTQRISNSACDGEMAIETAGTSYIVVWEEPDPAESRIVYLRYMLLDAAGAPLGPARMLATEGSGLISGDIRYLSVAVAPGGAIGVSWVLDEQRTNEGRHELRSNVYMATLVIDGDLLLAPTNLSENPDFGDLNPPWYMANLLRYTSSHIAAAAEGRFLVAWKGEYAYGHYCNSGITYTMREADGTIVKSNTGTNTAPMGGGCGLQDVLRLAAMAGGGVMMEYLNFSNPGTLIEFFDSNGESTEKPAWGGPELPVDVEQVNDGTVLVAWSRSAAKAQAQGEPQQPAIMYGYIDAAVRDPDGYALQNVGKIAYMGCAAGATELSLKALAGGRAVMTWGNSEPACGPQLYYAMIGPSGAQLTAATPFLTGRFPADAKTPRIESSNNGYGIAAGIEGAPTATEQPDVYVTVAPSVSGKPGGVAQLVLDIGNTGLATATHVIVTALLAPQLGYSGATPGPSSVIETDGGTRATWSTTDLITDLAYLTQGRIVLATRVPSATVGTAFPLTVTVTLAETDANLANNNAGSTVVAADPVYAPVIAKNQD